MLGVPKTSLKFDYFLEELTELRKAVLSTVTVHYGKRIQIKITQSSPNGVRLFQQWCVTAQEAYCQPGQLTQTLVSGISIGEVGLTGMGLLHEWP